MTQRTIPTAHSRQDNRGQWRVEEKMLEQYIEERYAEASRMIQESRSKSV